MVCHADNLTDFDVLGMVEAHVRRPMNCSISMLAFRTDSPTTCGILETDAEGVVTGFHEKVENPPGNLANAAVYIFEPDVIHAIESIGSHVVDLSKEVLPRFLGRIQMYQTRGYHRDVGSIESLHLAELEYPLSIC
jgi:mannose-1-phosphate guanylyltransferase